MPAAPHRGRLERVGLQLQGKLDAALVRAQNQRLLLNIVWCESGISRAEIARRTGLSRSTVSAIVEDLLETGLVCFGAAGDSKGGRRPITLQFQDAALKLVGVDIGATHVAVALTDLRGKVIHWASQPHGVRDDPGGTLSIVESLVEAALVAAGVTASSVVGIGVGVPSPVDPNRPARLSPLILPAWWGHDIPGRLEKKFGRPVWVDNDANLGALAELWWGAGADGKDLAYIKMGTGIGAGHIVNGAIYRGATGVAGEIGHIAIDPQGPLCLCGLEGCLVTFVGSEALVAQVREMLRAGRTSVLDPATLTQAALVEAAVAGDAVAREVIERAGRRLGIAVASLFNLMNPATVVVGGSLTLAGDLVMEPLRETVRRRTLWLSLDEARIVSSELGEREVAIGAATLVLQNALDAPSLFPKVDGALRAAG
ncbi:MAG: glucokinase-like ROK family protein [Myxococcota bacterium]|jgi:glucokinase-like ROK family protein